MSFEVGFIVYFKVGAGGPGGGGQLYSTAGVPTSRKRLPFNFPIFFREMLRTIFIFFIFIFDLDHVPPDD